MNPNSSKAELRLVNSLRKYIPDIGQQLSIDRYLYDIFYKDKIIEFNGDYWHGNPELYLFEDYVGNIINNKPTYAYELWARDAKKMMVAENRGYKVMVVWESEFMEMPKDTIKKCLSFLKS